MPPYAKTVYYRQKVKAGNANRAVRNVKEVPALKPTAAASAPIPGPVPTKAEAEIDFYFNSLHYPERPQPLRGSSLVVRGWARRRLIHNCRGCNRNATSNI